MMKQVFVFVALLPIMAFAEADPYFEIASVEVEHTGTEVLNLNYFSSSSAIGTGACSPVQKSVFFSKAGDLSAADILVPLNTADVVFDKVVNLGKKVWDLIDAGKPVVDLKTDVATALPAGPRCWLDLETWQAPVAQTYTMVYKNTFGSEVIRFAYRVIFLSGGSLGGKGAYIGYATIQPAEVKVAWGFKFSAQASVTAVYNMGTKENPVGAIDLEMHYIVKPILGVQHHEGMHAFHLTGAGALQRIK